MRTSIVFTRGWGRVAAAGALALLLAAPGAWAGEGPARVPGVVAPAAAPVRPGASAVPAGAGGVESPDPLRGIPANHGGTSGSVPQDSPGPGALTMEQALEEALRESPVLRQYRSRIREAGHRVDEVEAGGRPRLSLQGGYTHLSPTLDFQSPGGPLPIVVSENWDVGIGLEQALYTFGRLEWGAEAAELAREAARQEYRREVDELLARVSQAFLEYRFRLSAVAVAAEQLAARQAHLKDVDVMYEAGVVADYDRMATRTAEAEASQALLSAKHRAELSRARLLVLLGRPADGTLELAGDALGEGMVESRADGLARALARRPELAALARAAEAARARARAEGASSNPSLGFATSYVRRTPTAFSTEDQWAAGVRLTVPLYDGGGAAARAAQAEEAALQLEEMLEATRRQVTLDVEESWLDLDEARQRLDVAMTGLAQAVEAERVASLRYKAGVSTNLELLDAQAARARARLDLAEAELRLRSARVRWTRATGAEWGVPTAAAAVEGAR